MYEKDIFWLISSSMSKLKFVGYIYILLSMFRRNIRNQEVNKKVWSFKTFSVPSSLRHFFWSMQKWLWTNCISRAGLAVDLGTQRLPDYKYITTITKYFDLMHYSCINIIHMYYLLWNHIACYYQYPNYIKGLKRYLI